MPPKEALGCCIDNSSNCTCSKRPALHRRHEGGCSCLDRIFIRWPSCPGAPLEQQCEPPIVMRLVQIITDINAKRLQQGGDNASTTSTNTSHRNRWLFPSQIAVTVVTLALYEEMGGCSRLPLTPLEHPPAKTRAWLHVGFSLLVLSQSVGAPRPTSNGRTRGGNSKGAGLRKSSGSREHGSCIVVLGMHRSATSALTRLVNHLGVSLPHSADLGVGRTPNSANVRGFWEPRLLVHENERILFEAGGRWHAPPPQSALAAVMSRGLSRYQRLVIAYHNQPTTWVWKDPRLCLTLALWRQSLHKPRAILLFRDPYAVASSLARRNGFPIELGLAIWERYVHSSLMVASGLPTLVVFQHEIMTMPRLLGDRILAWLEGLPLTMPPQLDQIETMIDPNLQTVQPLADPEVPVSCSTLWKIVSELPPATDSFNPPPHNLSDWASVTLESHRVDLEQTGNLRGGIGRVRLAQAWALELIKRSLRSTPVDAVDHR